MRGKLDRAVDQAKAEGADPKALRIRSGEVGEVPSTLHASPAKDPYNQLTLASKEVPE